MQVIHGDAECPHRHEVPLEALIGQPDRPRPASRAGIKFRQPRHAGGIVAHPVAARAHRIPVVGRHGDGLSGGSRGWLTGR